MSKYLSLNTQDFIKGLVVAVLSAIIAAVLDSLQSGKLNLDPKTIGTTAAVAGLSYLSKNLVTNQNGELLKKDQ